MGGVDEMHDPRAEGHAVAGGGDSVADSGVAGPNDVSPAFFDSTRAMISVTWRFLFLLVVFFTLLYLDEHVFGGAVIGPITVVVAHAVSVSLGLFGADVEITDNIISHNEISLEVAPECLGLQVYGLFIAATLSVPVPWSSKLEGVLKGVAALAFLNFLRIGTLVLLAESEDALSFGHLYAWPPILIFIGMGLWLAWIYTHFEELRF